MVLWVTMPSIQHYIYNCRSNNNNILYYSILSILKNCAIPYIAGITKIYKHPFTNFHVIISWLYAMKYVLYIGIYAKWIRNKWNPEIFRGESVLGTNWNVIHIFAAVGNPRWINYLEIESRKWDGTRSLAEKRRVIFLLIWNRLKSWNVIIVYHIHIDADIYS